MQFFFSRYADMPSFVYWFVIYPYASIESIDKSIFIFFILKRDLLGSRLRIIDDGIGVYGEYF